MFVRVFFSGGTFFQNSINNAGSSIVGGTGGAAGSGLTNGAAGAGGAGVTGSFVTLTNTGSISGGLSGNGSTRADALAFTGGSNFVTTNAGGSYTGNFSIANSNSGTLTLLQTAAGSATGSAAYSNVITGSGSVAVTTDSGYTVTLSGANTYTGGTALTSGTLVIGNSSALGSGNLSMAAGTTLSFSNTGNFTVGNNISISGDPSFSPPTGTTQTITGVISNATGGAPVGSVVVDGGGTLALTNTNTYSGSTTINAGSTLALQGGGSISSSSVVTANGTFDISAASASFNPIAALAGSGTVALGGNSLVITAGSTEFSGAINGTGGLEIFGGAQTLSGANTYSGVTQINSGATLALKGGGSIANSLFVGFAPIAGGIATFDISQTNNGASVAGLFDPTGVGVVSLGSKTLTITSNVGTFNGVIADGGIAGGVGGNVTIANGGLETFGGVNTYTGFTTINAGGELDLFLNGSIAASKAVINNGIFDISGVGSGNSSIGSLSGANTGIVILGLNTLTITNANGTFAGVIQDNGAGGSGGRGSLAITGGKQILTGVNTYSGTTTIAGATLEVDGAITNTSSVTVSAGGTLSGTGLIDPTTTTIMSGGTLKPGSTTNPTGMLSITGNLAFQSGALYLVAVTPSAAASTSVSGTATLTGATVNAQFAAGSYLTKQYTILTAAGGLGGTTFAGLTNTNLPAGFTENLSYGGNSVFLNLTGALSISGLNQNQQNVANRLNNFFNSGGALPPNFFNVFGLTGGALGGALSQLDGEAATGAERGAFQIMTQFLGSMLDPFVYGRAGSFGASGGGAIGFAPEQEANLPPDIALAYASILTKAPPQSFDQRWTAWGSAYGGANNANGDPAVGSTTVSARTFGFAAGMDYHVTPNTVVGFALAGGGLNWGLANAMGGGRSDALQAGVYGISYLGPAYLAGALAFTNHWFNTNRSALGDALTATFTGQSYGGRLEGGYRFGVLPTLGVTPYAAVQAQDFRTPAYSESDLTNGGFGLSYAAMNATDVRTELGSRFDAPTLVAGMPLILRARAAWAHDFVSNPALSAAFEALPGGSFTVNGAPIAHDSALTSAGAELFLTPRWTLLAKFDGEFANGSQTYAGSGTLRYSW